MRFLVDECTGPAVADWLRQQSHEVFSIYDEARGLDDDAILDKAFAEDWLLITNDKDFGEKVYRERRSHKGVVLLRLADERAANKIVSSASCSRVTLISCLANSLWQLNTEYDLPEHSKTRVRRHSCAPPDLKVF